MPMIIVNPKRSHIADLVCNQVQREPMENQEPCMLINQSNHNTRDSHCDSNALIKN